MSSERETVRITDRDDWFRGIATETEPGKTLVAGASPDEVIRGSRLDSAPGQPAVVEPKEILESNPHRREPSCPYFGRCNGCQLQHVNYHRELVLKQNRLRQLLEPDFDPDDVLKPIIPSPKIYHYRSKLVFHGPINQPGFWSVKGLKRLPVDTCSLAVPELQTMVEGLADGSRRDPRINPENDLLLRTSNTGQKVLAPASPDQQHNLWITEEVPVPDSDGAREFVVPSHGFWQVNRPMLPRLVREITSRVRTVNPDYLLEGYCGVGLFGLLCANAVREVTGIETNPLSVEAARRNRDRFSVDNITFRAGSTDQVLPDLLVETPLQRCLLLLDPPREGLSEPVRQAILAHPPQTILYLSCNPKTQIRDLNHLDTAGYTLQELVPMDQFPRTRHLESLALLEHQHC